MTTITGGCFCGSVRYRISAPLGPGRSCHCSRCRKAFSGASSAYAEVVPAAGGAPLYDEFPPKSSP